MRFLIENAIVAERARAYRQLVIFWLRFNARAPISIAKLTPDRGSDPHSHFHRRCLYSINRAKVISMVNCKFMMSTVNTSSGTQRRAFR